MEIPGPASRGAGVGEPLHLLGVKGTLGPHAHHQPSSHGHVYRESSTQLGGKSSRKTLETEDPRGPTLPHMLCDFEQGTLPEPHCFL